MDRGEIGDIAKGRGDAEQNDLLKDFSDEIVGYLNNGRIADDLQKLNLKPGVDAINDNLIACYTMMIDRGHIGVQEMGMLKAWIDDCRVLLP